MAATTNPLHGAHHVSTTPQISSQTFTIAGILVTIQGLSELPSNASSVACLWLLHPRLQTRESMFPLGAQIIDTYNKSRPSKSTKAPPKQLTLY